MQCDTEECLQITNQEKCWKEQSLPILRHYHDICIHGRKNPRKCPQPGFEHGTAQVHVQYMFISA
jgi:hypothetical protein